MVFDEFIFGTTAVVNEYVADTFLRKGCPSSWIFAITAYGASGFFSRIDPLHLPGYKTLSKPQFSFRESLVLRVPLDRPCHTINFVLPNKRFD